MVEKKKEARGGFEPPNGGFADLSLRPLGYGAHINDGEFSQGSFSYYYYALHSSSVSASAAESFHAVSLRIVFAAWTYRIAHTAKPPVRLI